MCGIWAWILASPDQQIPDTNTLWEQGVKGVSARGPEGYRFVQTKGNGATFGFTRLAINGLNEAGMQPFEQKGNQKKYQRIQRSWFGWR